MTMNMRKAGESLLQTDDKVSRLAGPEKICKTRRKVLQMRELI